MENSKLCCIVQGNLVEYIIGFQVVVSRRVRMWGLTICDFLKNSTLEKCDDMVHELDILVEWKLEVVINIKCDHRELVRMVIHGVVIENMLGIEK
jgi:hypothetical protein